MDTSAALAPSTVTAGTLRSSNTSTCNCERGRSMLHLLNWVDQGQHHRLVDQTDRELSYKSPHSILDPTDVIMHFSWLLRTRTPENFHVRLSPTRQQKRYRHQIRLRGTPVQATTPPHRAAEWRLELHTPGRNLILEPKSLGCHDCGGLSKIRYQLEASVEKSVSRGILQPVRPSQVGSLF